jgi:uncharacterized Zn finger protein
MANTVPQTDQHLNETPQGAFILAALTAVTDRDFKALATTIQRGTTLLQDGYAFVRANAGVYLVANPDGDVYNVAYDQARNVASCTCEACVRLGVCKHLICLYLCKPEIDAENDKREANARAYDASKQQPAGTAGDRWLAFFDEVDAAIAARKR